MFEIKICYKGYNVWDVSDNIVMLYSPKGPTKTMHHALSFDGGETWCVANCSKIVHTNFKGSFIDTIDVCIGLNKEIQNER